MSWSSSIFVGVLTAAVGAIAAGFVANLAVSWYRISSFEAGSAAFVVGFAILGIVVGFLIGVIASRTIGASVSLGFLKSLGTAQAVLLSLVAIVGVSARLLADVPPTIDGDTLMLAVEVRWPDGHTTSPATLPGEPSVTLGTLTGSNVMRASSRGPLWVQDAREVEGRWVAPGAVDIFTGRGTFVIDVELDSATHHGVMIPLSGRPSTKDMQWSDWMPHARPGTAPLPNGFRFRYRVQKRSEPVRTEVFGPFGVSTIARYFFNEDIGGKNHLAANAEFSIQYHGKPLVVRGRSSESEDTVEYSRAEDVAAVAGPKPALLAYMKQAAAVSACFLIVDEGNDVRTEYVPGCANPSGTATVTSDSSRFREASDRRIPRGHFDRLTLATPGLFLTGQAVLDTRRLSVHEFQLPNDYSLVPSVPPLAVSPDERSFARFGYAQHSDAYPVLLVTDVVGNRSYMLPIDRPRMRYADLHSFNPAWVMHHFAWERDKDGVDSLVERKGFVPIPYHGDLSVSGDYRAYRLTPARQELRDAIIAFLVDDMKAERVAIDTTYAYDFPVKINGQTVNVAYGSTGDYVSVTLERGAKDMTLLEAVAKRIDAALATGKYDALFGK